MKFEKGGSKVGKLEVLGNTNKTGSMVRFLADKRFSAVLTTIMPP